LLVEPKRVFAETTTKRIRGRGGEKKPDTNIKFCELGKKKRTGGKKSTPSKEKAQKSTEEVKEVRRGEEKYGGPPSKYDP